MADHSKPLLTSTYVDFVEEVKGRLSDISLGFDPAHTSATNIPVNTIRWSSASKRWYRWNGSEWVDLASSYAINITGSAAKLAQERTIALSGAATGEATAFDGSKNIAINVTEVDASKLKGSVPIESGGTGGTTTEQARTNLGLGSAAQANVTTSQTDTTEGRLLKSSDFGIGNAIILPIGTDLDDVIQPAAYRWALSNAPSNRPSGADYAHLSVTSWGDGAQQVVIPSGAARMFFRTKNNSSSAWSGWMEVFHSGNLPATNWNSLDGKPSTFPPSAHSHGWGEVLGKPAQATRWPAWGEVTGKPGAFTPPTGHGGVGTYALVSSATNNTLTNWGGTLAGSSLRPSAIQRTATSITVQVSSTTLAGTWRVMSSSAGRANNLPFCGLAVRIS